MDVLSKSETNEYSSDSEKNDEQWSTIDAGTSNINSKPDNTENQELNKDIPNLSDISVSSTDTYSPKSVNRSTYLRPIEITNWEPRLIDDKLVISGIFAGCMQTERVCKQRISSLIFKDDDGVTCYILGPMKTENEVPEMIRNQFKYAYEKDINGELLYRDGLPDNWLKLCILWRFYMETENKNSFDWILHLNSLAVKPLPKINNIQRDNGKKLNNGPKSKIKKKYEKYKRMLEQEILRDGLNADSETDVTSDVCVRLRKKPNNKINEQTSLYKRTSCYINNQIPFGESPTPTPTPTSTLKTVYSQTDLTSNDFEVKHFYGQDDDKNTNVTILSPIKFKKILTAKCALPPTNDSLNKLRKNEANKKIMKNSYIDSNDDSNSLDFYQNVCANSTIAPQKNQQNDTRKQINYICSKTLEKFEHRAQNSTENIDDDLDIDIDVFSQSVLKKPDNNKQQKSTANKGVKRKKDTETSPIRCSFRKRKKINYRELLFNPIRISDSSSIILDTKKRRSLPPISVINQSRKQLKTDEKLTKNCWVVLIRENLESKKTNIEKEHVNTSTQTSSSPVEHVFKAPLTTVVRKSKATSRKLNKTFHIPKYMPKIPRKKLSLPANPAQMWNIIKCNNINHNNSRRNDVEPPSSPFSNISETSTDSSDKKRRKLFSPDNWMQSDGYLKTLSQNQYQSSDDSRFSIRFNTSDQNIDSEFSDSSSFPSSFK